MKWLTLLMAFIVLSLSVAPAVAVVVAPTEEAGCCGGACAEDEAPDSDEASAASCNPFLACCPGFIPSAFSFRVASITPFHTSPAALSVSGESQFYPSFWQPPKIVS